MSLKLWRHYFLTTFLLWVLKEEDWVLRNQNEKCRENRRMLCKIAFALLCECWENHRRRGEPVSHKHLLAHRELSSTFIFHLLFKNQLLVSLINSCLYKQCSDNTAKYPDWGLTFVLISKPKRNLLAPLVLIGCNSSLLCSRFYFYKPVCWSTAAIQKVVGPCFMHAPRWCGRGVHLRETFTTPCGVNTPIARGRLLHPPLGWGRWRWWWWRQHQTWPTLLADLR